jgi:hypothetical protein
MAAIWRRGCIPLLASCWPGISNIGSLLALRAAATKSASQFAAGQYLNIKYYIITSCFLSGILSAWQLLAAGSWQLFVVRCWQLVSWQHQYQYTIQHT